MGQDCLQQGFTVQHSRSFRMIERKTSTFPHKKSISASCLPGTYMASQSTAQKGEAPMLSHSERNTILKLVARVRKDMDRVDSTALVVGCSGQSTREVVAMCKDAAECGGDCDLVLPPSYWFKASTAQVIEDFYTEVSLMTKLPIFTITLT